MAQPMKSKSFLRSSEGAVASYSFTDLAAGTGIDTFYGYAADISSGATTAAYGYKLAQQLFEPAIADNVTVRNISGAATAVTFNLPPFNLPRIANGNMTSNFSYNVENLDGGAQHSGAVIVNLLKNGTSVASGSTKTTVVNAGSNTMVTSVLPITVPLTLYKKDDTMAVYFKGFTEDPVNVRIWLWFDPQDRDDSTTSAPNITAATNTTKLTTYIPFRIDT